MSGSVKVLVVDDEPQFQRFLKPSLTASGFRVIPAATAAEALLTFKSSGADLVILDLRLPDADGRRSSARYGVHHGYPSSCSRRGIGKAKRLNLSTWVRRISSISRSASANCWRGSRARPEIDLLTCPKRPTRPWTQLIAAKS